MAESRVPHLQVGAVVLGDVRTVALTEDRDLLLDVLDLVLGLLQVDGLDGDNALCAIIDSFKHLWGGGNREEELLKQAEVQLLVSGKELFLGKKHSIKTIYGGKMAAKARTSPKEPFPMRSSLVNNSSGSI